MNEKIKILLLFLLFGLVGCTKETDPVLEPDDDYLTSGTNSSFVIKYAKANSSTAEEKSIKDIWVFAIHNRTKTVRKISKGELLGEGSFKVSLFISQDDTEQEKYMLVVVANANDVIAANPEKYLGMSYAEFTENLVNANDVTATSFDDIAGKGIAMWGDSDYVSIYLSGIHPKLPAIILSRAIARMTIGVGTSTTGVDGKVTWDGKAMVDGVPTDIPFQLTSINLVRSESRYSFAPGFDKDGNMKYNDALNKATAASVPAVSTTYEMTNSLSYPLDPMVIKGRSDIYMPESKIIGVENRYTHFAIVLGGKFETDVVDSYYRVDIKQGENFLDVLRNHNYQLNIRSVSTRGAATIEDAYKDAGRPIDVDVTIVPWNPVTIDLPTDDGGIVTITPKSDGNIRLIDVLMSENSNYLISDISLKSNNIPNTPISCELIEVTGVDANLLTLKIYNEEGTEATEINNNKPLKLKTDYTSEETVTFKYKITIGDVEYISLEHNITKGSNVIDYLNNKTIIYKEAVADDVILLIEYPSITGPLKIEDIILKNVTEGLTLTPVVDNAKKQITISGSMTAITNASFDVEIFKYRNSVKVIQNAPDAYRIYTSKGVAKEPIRLTVKSAKVITSDDIIGVSFSATDGVAKDVTNATAAPLYIHTTNMVDSDRKISLLTSESNGGIDEKILYHIPYTGFSAYYGFDGIGKGFISREYEEWSIKTKGYFHPAGIDVRVAINDASKESLTLKSRADATAYVNFLGEQTAEQSVLSVKKRWDNGADNAANNGERKLILQYKMPGTAEWSNVINSEGKMWDRVQWIGNSFTHSHAKQNTGGTNILNECYSVVTRISQYSYIHASHPLTGKGKWECLRHDPTLGNIAHTVFHIMHPATPDSFYPYSVKADRVLTGHHVDGKAYLIYRSDMGFPGHTWSVSCTTIVHTLGMVYRVRPTNAAPLTK